MDFWLIGIITVWFGGVLAWAIATLIWETFFRFRT
jgi:hypothetical protein